MGKTTLIQAIKRSLDIRTRVSSLHWFSYSFTKTDHQVVDNIKAPKSIKSVGSDRTVGVDLSTMKLAHGDISVWDFGGQLEYAVTHQLLLSVEVNTKNIISSSHPLN